MGCMSNVLLKLDIHMEGETRGEGEEQTVITLTMRDWGHGITGVYIDPHSLKYPQE